MEMETQSCQFGKLYRVQTLSNSSKRGAAGKFMTCNPAIIFKCISNDSSSGCSCKITQYTQLGVGTFSSHNINTSNIKA
jgi:hypothetical protein